MVKRKRTGKAVKHSAEHAAIQALEKPNLLAIARQMGLASERYYADADPNGVDGLTGLALLQELRAVLLTTTPDTPLDCLLQVESCRTMCAFMGLIAEVALDRGEAERVRALQLVRSGAMQVAMGLVTAATYLERQAGTTAKELGMFQDQAAALN